MSMTTSVSSHREFQSDALQWSDLSVILAICRSGTLSGAARSLGLNHSTVFRKINAIEKSTGVRFFERLPNGYEMTEAGHIAQKYAEKVEAEMHDLSREILGRDTRLEGKVLITAPEFFASFLLPDIILGVRDQHPGLSFDVIPGSAALDLSRREADIAIRATAQPPDASLGRKICDFRFCVYASPGYLERNPGLTLKQHDWVMLREAPHWLVPRVWKNRQALERSATATFSSVIGASRAAESGLGLLFTSCYMGDLNPGLVPVMKPVGDFTIELWVLTHPDLRQTARVKVCMNYIVEYLKARQHLFEGRKALEHENVLYHSLFS